jgi:hypothetical protein
LLQPDVADELRNGCQQLLSENGARYCAIELLRPLYDQRQLEWATNILSPRIVHALDGISDGSTAGLSDWFSQLMPCGQFESTARSDLAALLPRLSTEAANEVSAVLANEQASTDSGFEERLIALLNLIQSISRKQSDEGFLRLLADEVLKTLGTAMKKQPYDARTHGERANWVAQIVEGVTSLLHLVDVEDSECDVLRLYRMFPKVVDVDVGESFELFLRFIRHRQSDGDPMHEVIHQLQVLKMTHQRVTREVLDTSLEGTTR